MNPSANAAIADELRPLTSLRFFAAMLVTLFHYYDFDGATETAKLWQIVLIRGHIGVTIFFVLSGFLLAWRYAESIKGGTFLFWDYWRKRFARIYPLYFVILIVVFLTEYGKIELSLRTLPSFTLTQSFFEGIKFQTVAPAWTLTIEESFYLLLPLVLLTFFWIQSRHFFADRHWTLPLMVTLLTWGIGLLGIGVGLVALSQAVGWASQWPYFMANIPHLFHFTIFGRFTDFAVGIAVAFLYSRSGLTHHWQTQRGSVFAVGLIVAGAAGIIASQYILNQYDVEYIWSTNLLTALSSAVVILGLTCEKTFIGRVLGLGVFVYLGRVSYALYLIQQTSIAENTLRDVVNTLFGTTLFAHLLALVLFSIVLYEAVEKPARVLILRLTQPLIDRRREQMPALPLPSSEGLIE